MIQPRIMPVQRPWGMGKWGNGNVRCVEQLNGKWNMGYSLVKMNMRTLIIAGTDLPEVPSSDWLCVSTVQHSVWGLEYQELCRVSQPGPPAPALQEEECNHNQDSFAICHTCKIWHHVPHPSSCHRRQTQYHTNTLLYAIRLRRWQDCDWCTV